MRAWPLHVYGANPSQGDTRSLAASVAGKDPRWRKLIDQGAKIFVVDHVQQYFFAAETSDYEKQLRSVSAIGDIVAQEAIVCMMLSQVSLTSVREAREGNGKIGAAGGQKSAQEANVVFLVKYQSGDGHVRIAIEDSRKSATFSVFQPLEEESGAFYGEASRSSETIT
jgi:hypothetical protein